MITASYHTLSCTENEIMSSTCQGTEVIALDIRQKPKPKPKPKPKQTTNKQTKHKKTKNKRQETKLRVMKKKCVEYYATIFATKIFFVNLTPYSTKQVSTCSCENTEAFRHARMCKQLVQNEMKPHSSNDGYQKIVDYLNRKRIYKNKQKKTKEYKIRIFRHV